MRLMFIAMGGSNHTAKWVMSLRDCGHDIMLVSFYPPARIEGIDTRYLKSRNRLSMLLKVGKVRRLIDEFKPDILHAHYASSCGLAAAMTGFRPLVLSVWGDDIMVFPDHSLIHRWLVKKAIVNADRVTATSRMLARATADIGQPREPISVIPFGVDLKRFQPIDRQGRSTVHIGTVRWLKPKYGIEYLIKAFAQLAQEHDNVKLTIIGRGFLRDYLQSLAESLNVADRVTFTGKLSNEEVVAYCGQFDVFVMPSVSRGETFGVAAVEAMATGLPVVASEIGGLPEVVDHGQTGLLVKPGDVDALRDALKYYVTSVEARLEHGRNARRRVEAHFDWADSVKAMNRLYDEILGKQV